ncbi:hypothetical protein AB0P41_35530 [Streptomyces sp. NPDC079167]|uniref:hypothetical protein n=1 Tax=Streptomyces sp. NPDC079167 TaxID=3154513 RepID=UPI0034303A3B
MASIEAILRQDAQDLAEGHDVQGKGVMSALYLAPGTSIEAGGQVRLPSGSRTGPRPGGLSPQEEAEVLMSGDQSVITRHQNLAQEGNAASARRAAELLESQAPHEAAQWWRIAADLGDEDAREYVAAFLTEQVQ